MTQRTETGLPPQEAAAPTQGSNVVDTALLLGRHWKLLCGGALAAGLVGLAVAFVWPPMYTARTSFLPPQQQQSAAASALASLSALSGLAGSMAAAKSPADQYVALLQSDSVTNRIIDHFKLLSVYDERYRVDARRELARRVQVSVGKKDGLISIEVEDREPRRAAEIANQHVDELRRVTAELALTEAQQRRVFFESELKKTNDRLAQAQRALGASGFNAGALKAEPKAAAEGYAKLSAEVTAAEVRLQTARRSLLDNTPEIQQLQATLQALRQRLAREEAAQQDGGNTDYVGKFREFKYQETLFELLAKQYEMARLDESREGVLIQVVDTAVPPEKRSRPKRGFIAVATTAAAFLILAMFIVARQSWRTWRGGGGAAFAKEGASPSAR